MKEIYEDEELVIPPQLRSPFAFKKRNPKLSSINKPFMISLWEDANERIFFGKMKLPKIRIINKRNGIWGQCVYGDKDKEIDYLDINFGEITTYKMLIDSFIHEMIHQFQYECQEYELKEDEDVVVHDETFYMWFPKINMVYNIKMSRNFDESYEADPF